LSNCADGLSGRLELDVRSATLARRRRNQDRV
jgi:hypothetical protein